jgi:predicted NUDIX family NTP pyrophosphohydrolase
MYRRGSGGGVEVLLVHPGGPFWANKDAGAWSIPKGEVTPDEDLLDAAKREFGEELGFEAVGEFQSLGMIKQKAGKLVHGWAFEGDCDPSKCQSNTYNVEWPPKSGKWKAFPEVDRAEFFSLEAAREKINSGQVPFLERLSDLLGR